MQKQYQIDKQRSVQQFRRFASEINPHLHRAAPEMAAFALNTGEPIFAALSDPNRALEILSGNDEEARTYGGPDEVRAMKAIALAFLLHGDFAARELSKAKLIRMRGNAVGALHRAVARLLERGLATE